MCPRCSGNQKVDLLNESLQRHQEAVARAEQLKQKLDELGGQHDQTIKASQDQAAEHRRLVDERNRQIKDLNDRLEQRRIRGAHVLCSHGRQP